MVKEKKGPKGKGAKNIIRRDIFLDNLTNKIYYTKKGGKNYEGNSDW
jgi:hypothetical protein